MIYLTGLVLMAAGGIASALEYGSLLPLYLTVPLALYLRFAPGSASRKNAGGDMDLSPDSTFADEGDFEAIPITEAQTVWRIEYQDFQGHRTAREITLKAVRKKIRHYYLLAFCHERRELRSFRLDRLVSAVNVSTGEVFEDGDALLRHLTAPQSALRGKLVAVSWPLERMDYPQVCSEINALGAILHSGPVTKEVDFVIVGAKSEQKKGQRASKLGVKTLSEDEWLQMLQKIKGPAADIRHRREFEGVN